MARVALHFANENQWVANNLRNSFNFIKKLKKRQILVTGIKHALAELIIHFGNHIPMLRPVEQPGSIQFLHWLSGLMLHLSFEVAIRNSISRN